MHSILYMTPIKRSFVNPPPNHGDRDPQIENHCFKDLFLLSYMVVFRC